MKHILILLIIVSGASLYGQSDSIEKDIIYKKVLSREISKREFSTIASDWNRLIKKIGGYPVLPINQKGEVQYSFIKVFKDLSKDKLFKRSLEWLAINHGLIPAYLYSDKEDGKIIVRNTFNVNDNESGNYTMIITVLDEKIMIEFVKIEYAIFYLDSLMEGKTVTYPSDEFFPVIIKKSQWWESMLEILKATNDFFNSEPASLSEYILKYDSKYGSEEVMK